MIEMPIIYIGKKISTQPIRYRHQYVISALQIKNKQRAEIFVRRYTLSLNQFNLDLNHQLTLEPATRANIIG